MMSYKFIARADSTVPRPPHYPHLIHYANAAGDGLLCLPHANLANPKWRVLSEAEVVQLPRRQWCSNCRRMAGE